MDENPSSRTPFLAMMSAVYPDMKMNLISCL